MSRLIFQEELLSDHERSYDTEESEEEDDQDKLDDNTGNEIIQEDEDENMKQIQQNRQNDENNEIESDSDTYDDENISKPSLQDLDLSEYSTFLTKFLTTKKTPQVPPPPQTIPLNDYILKEFALSEKGRYHQQVEKEETEDESVHSSESREEAQIFEQFSGNIENESPCLFVLTLFNLPYNMTTDEVLEYVVFDVISLFLD